MLIGFLYHEAGRFKCLKSLVLVGTDVPNWLGFSVFLKQFPVLQDLSVQTYSEIRKNDPLKVERLSAILGSSLVDSVGKCEIICYAIYIDVALAGFPAGVQQTGNVSARFLCTSFIGGATDDVHIGIT
jgi:hypothetical protein